MMAEDELRKAEVVDEHGHWRDPLMNREDVWRQALVEEGHVAFVLDDIEYFVVPLRAKESHQGVRESTSR